MVRTPTIDASSPALSVRNLCKKSDQGAIIFEEASFQIPRGEIVALIGTSQSGKSMLFQCCAGLSAIDSGSIQLLGTEINGVPTTKLRRLWRRIGFIADKPNLIGEQTVLGNLFALPFSTSLSGPAWLSSRANPRKRALALKILELLGMKNSAKRKASSLSFEEAQRVCLARTIFQRPEIIFADDPLALFDPIVAQDMVNLLVSFVREHQITLFFSSQHLEHAIRYADRIVALCEGRIELDAPVREPTQAHISQAG